MIRDDDLKSSIDYSEGQKRAAHRVLVELVNVFREYEDEIRVVGGWVPDLMFPEEGHVGSVDVDIMINHLTLQDEGYQNMSRILQKNGYKEHPEKYFSFIKRCNRLSFSLWKIMFSEMRRKKREMDTEAAESLLKCSRRGILAVNGDNMKIVIIHGQSHKGSTYHIAHMLAEKLDGEIKEFFLPRDFGEFCVGCTRCILESEKKCPHYEKLKPLTAAIDEADVIILASPVYVYHATGSMKAFLDHYGYRWMVHCPEESMFKKQGVCISTAAGAGMKSTNKDMMDSLLFWGVARIYQYGVSVAAVNWNGVSEKKKRKIDIATSEIAKKIRNRSGNVKPGIKSRGMFMVMRFMQKIISNPKDVAYWEGKGWLGKERPWE